MDAQVLLLIDPGAELGWAELSDRLPSGGGRGNNMRTKAILQSLFFLDDSVFRYNCLASDDNAFQLVQCVCLTDPVWKIYDYIQ